MGARCQQRAALWPRCPHAGHNFRSTADMELGPAEATAMHHASVYRMRSLHLLYPLHLFRRPLFKQSCFNKHKIDNALLYVYLMYL